MEPYKNSTVALQTYLAAVVFQCEMKNSSELGPVAEVAE